MFGKKKEKQKIDSLNFKSENYQMKDSYNTDNLVVGNLEYISSEVTPYGPMVKKTTQKFIRCFEGEERVFNSLNDFLKRPLKKMCLNAEEILGNRNLR